MEFDFALAWHKHALPACIAAPAQALAILDLYASKEGQRTHQNKDLSIPLLTGVQELADQLEMRPLLEAAHTIYYCGHWWPSGPTAAAPLHVRNAQSRVGGGAYWKAQRAMIQLAIARSRSEYAEIGHQVKLLVDRETKRYKCSSTLMKARDVWRGEHPKDWWELEEPDSLYTYPDGKDTEYIAEWLDRQLTAEERAGLGRIVGARCVNHRLKDGVYPVNSHASPRGPFTIGRAHMKGDSIYLDPNSAPCARTGNPYSDFTYDTVVLLPTSCLEDERLREELKPVLKRLADISSLGGKPLFDGFAFANAA